MLTVRVPATWQDLQNEVATLLSQCGFTADVERLVDLGRGQAKVDVYAEESINGRRNVILCECKYWRSAVPQHVIHSFRTVANEAGANVGYIIGLSGFQAGAYEATKRTNVKLVTWQEFQDEFEATWIHTHFIPTITSVLDPLLTYTEPFAPAWFEDLDEGDREAYMAAYHRHFPLGYLSLSLSLWGRMHRTTSFPALPLRVSEGQRLPAGLPDAVLDATGYADLLALMLEYGEQAIAEFRVFRDKSGFKGAE
jgi:restriction system protein